MRCAVLARTAAYALSAGLAFTAALARADALDDARAALEREPERALQLAEPVIAEAERRGDVDRLREARLIAGQAASHCCDREQAARWLLAVAPEYATLGDGARARQAWQALSSMHFRQGDYVKAQDAAQHVLESARASGDRKSEAQALNDLGVLFKRRGRAVRALDHYEQALEVRRAIDDRVGEAQSLNNIAILHKNWGNFHQALSLQLQALAIRRTLDRAEALAESLDNVGLIYAALEDYDEAERYHREALAQLPQGGKDDQRARVLGNLGEALRMLGRPGEALAVIDEGERLARAGQFAPTLQYILLTRGALERVRGRLDAARAALEESLAIAERNDDTKGRAQAQLELADAYLAARDGAAAERAARLALDRAREDGMKPLTREALQRLSDAQYLSGNATSAYLTRLEYEGLERELATALASRRVADLDASLERQRAESQLAVLRAENTAAESRVARQRWAGVALITTIAMLLAIAAQIHGRYRRARQTSAVLARRAGEMEILAHNDALTGVRSRVWMAERLLLAVQNAERDGMPLSVILLDLDHFKGINDTHGHQAGDAALREAARRIAQQLPHHVALARWGGEEFLVMCAGEDAITANTRAHEILRALRNEPMILRGQRVTLSASLGVATRRAGDSVDALLQRADAALYSAKRAGRGRVAQEAT
jgi:diguanylate cyclase (GGDEF)-like protein